MGLIHPDLSDLGNTGVERHCSVGGSGMDGQVSLPSKSQGKKKQQRKEEGLRRGKVCGADPIGHYVDYVHMERA